MKKILALIIVSLLTSSFSQTWTLHNAKDNYMYVCIYGEWTILECAGTTTGGAAYVTEAYWDWGGDIAYPQWAYSGAKSGVLRCGGWQYPSQSIGYSDVQTITFCQYPITDPIIVGGGSFIDFQIWYLSGGYPDYGGGGEFTPPAPGEYWIDFAVDGSIRVSASQPADFGKWAWDGSINPNWIEPLQGKRLAKGHRK